MKKLAILLLLALPMAVSAQSLADQVQAYLTMSGIAATSADWSTCQSEGQADQICTWDATKLGAQPTPAQLTAAATYWTNQQQAKQFNSVLSSGVTVTCASGATICTSAIQGTYAVDENAQLKIAATQTSIDGGHGLPGGGSVFLFKDINGVGHAFTAAQFSEFAVKARDFYYAASVAEAELLAGQAASWPSSAVQLP